MRFKNTICRSMVLAFLLLLAGVASHGADIWQDAEKLKETVGNGHEWDDWTPAQLEGWKHIENFGAFYPWSDWIYHLDHGWLYPVGEDLGNLWGTPVTRLSDAISNDILRDDPPASTAIHFTYENPALSVTC